MIDRAAGRIYAVTDNGSLVTVSLANGADAAPPLALIDRPTTNRVWGGLNLSAGKLYITTASDGGDTPPWRGQVYELATGPSTPTLVTTWTVVPSFPAPTGGGGIWGYGGVSIDTATGHVYAATAADSNELYTLYGNRIVGLDAGLNVLGSYLPSEPGTFPCSGDSLRPRLRLDAPRLQAERLRDHGRGGEQERKPLRAAHLGPRGERPAAADPAAERHERLARQRWRRRRPGLLGGGPHGLRDRRRYREWRASRGASSR